MTNFLSINSISVDFFINFKMFKKLKENDNVSVEIKIKLGMGVVCTQVWLNDLTLQ